MRNISLQKSCSNKARKLVPSLFVFFKKALYELKTSGSTLVSICFCCPRLRHKIKTNCMKIQAIDLEICSIFKKGLGLVSPPYFVHDFARKIFFMIYSINWPNFFVWLPLLFEVSGNMIILILCWVINSEICLDFLNKPVTYISKNWAKIKISQENLKVFWCFQGVEKGYIEKEWVKVK